MARIFQCGFEGGTADLLNWNQGGTLGDNIDTDTPGFWSNYSNHTWYLGFAGQWLDDGPYTGDVYFRCYWRAQQPSLLNQSGMVVGFWDSSVRLNCYMYWNGTLLEVYRAEGISDVLLGDAGSVNPLEWQLIEVHFKPHASAGAFDVRVNEIERFTFTGDTVGTAYPSGDHTADFKGLMWGRISSANLGGMLFDDIALNDTTSANNNTWIGDGGIMGLFPNGAGDSTQWSATSGANYTNVDEDPPDEETTIVYTDVAGEKDLYTLNNLSVLLTDVNAVSVNVRSRKNPPGAAVLKGIMKSSATEELTDALELSPTWRTRGQLYNISPFTTTAWTDDEVNDLQAGVKLE